MENAKFKLIKNYFKIKKEKNSIENNDDQSINFKGINNEIDNKSNDSLLEIKKNYSLIFNNKATINKFKELLKFSEKNKKLKISETNIYNKKNILGKISSKEINDLDETIKELEENNLDDTIKELEENNPNLQNIIFLRDSFALDDSEEDSSFSKDSPNLIRSDREIKNSELKKHPEFADEKNFDKVNFFFSYIKEKEKIEKIKINNISEGDKQKILIADDNKVLRESMITLVKKYLENKKSENKYEIIGLNDGRGIIDLILEDVYQDKIRLIISDENMGLVNGSSAVKLSKEVGGKFANEKKYILASSDNVIDYKKIGFDYSVKKPMKLDEISELLDRILK